MEPTAREATLPRGSELPALPTAATTAASHPSPYPTAPSGFSAGPLAAGLLLAALAATAFALARKRRASPRLVEILESASLGPKRSLVLARLGDEVILLGSCEGGITLLSSRPAESVVRATADGPTPSLATPPSASTTARGLGLGLLRDLFPRRSASASPAFEGYLAESVEDVELRRKLAAGQKGHIP